MTWTLRLSLLFSLLALDRGTASAESTATTGPLAFGVAGVLVVDVASSAANVLALTSDESNRTHAYLGVAAGLVSLGLVALNYAMEDDAGLRDQFGLVMGAAGATSLTLGLINLRRDGERRGRDIAHRRVSVYPALFRDGARPSTLGIAARVEF